MQALQGLLQKLQIIDGDMPGSGNDGSTNGAMNQCQLHEGLHDPAEYDVAKEVTEG